MKAKVPPAPTPAQAGPTRRRLLPRYCACGGVPGIDGDCENCRSERLLSPRAAAANMLGVLQSPGQVLDSETRAFMERRFTGTVESSPGQRPSETPVVTDRDEPEANRLAARALHGTVPATTNPGCDFSRVRVHTGPAAASAARTLGARAFSIGPHVAFGEGEFAPRHERGRRLLAHELAHTLQAGSGRRIARQTLGGVETTAVDVDRSEIEKLVGLSYWENKVAGRYALTFMNSVQARFKADAEERDAVLSVLWQHHPDKPVTADTETSVAIPARPGAPKSEPLFYTFTFKPAPKGGQETVEVDLKASGARAKVAAAPAPPAGYAPPALSVNAGGFPAQSSAYWQAHPDEQKQLYSWIETAPGPAVDQIVTTSEQTAGGKKHDSSYQVKIAKDAAGKITSLDVDLLSQSALTEQPPAGYDSKDLEDNEIEKLQARAKDKLGQVKGLATLPKDEALSVKYVVTAYFQGGTRNKEVDVIVPIANKTTRVLYTLRFRPTTNDVDIERVGEEGSSAKLTLSALSITRVEGFAANSTDAAAFSKWIAKRYPGVTPTGATLPELQDSVNQQMTASAATPAWFKANYGMEILDATAAETRLQSIHKLSSAETVNLKAFVADDLKLLEFALETMSDTELQVVRGTQMARQDVLIEIKNKLATPDPKMGGITRENGTQKTITIFDSATSYGDRLFRGGSGGVRPSPVHLYAHELGHVIGDQSKLIKPFNDFVKKNGIKPITKYAASNPTGEFFPEAFAIFQTDPEWMQTNLPSLYAWFDAVKTTGKPPP